MTIIALQITQISQTLPVKEIIDYMFCLSFFTSIHCSVWICTLHACTVWLSSWCCRYNVLYVASQWPHLHLHTYTHVNASHSEVVVLVTCAGCLGVPMSSFILWFVQKKGCCVDGHIHVGTCTCTLYVHMYMCMH